MAPFVPQAGISMMFLTRDEVIELTGKKQRAAQVAVLNALGITHKIRPDGAVLVLRAHVEQVFDGQTPAPQQRPAWEPDWDAFAALEAERARKRQEQQAQRAAKKEKINQERARKGLRPLR